jgi:hypothetical protein
LAPPAFQSANVPLDNVIQWNAGNRDWMPATQCMGKCIEHYEAGAKLKEAFAADQDRRISGSRRLVLSLRTSHGLSHRNPSVAVASVRSVPSPPASAETHMGPVVRPRSRPACSIVADERTPRFDRFLSRDSLHEGIGLAIRFERLFPHAADGIFRLHLGSHSAPGLTSSDRTRRYGIHRDPRHW